MSNSRRIWDDVVPESDRATYALGGLGQRSGIGERPALLIVDVTTEFTGDRPEPTHASVRRFPLSCGESAWDALPRIRKLLEAARTANIPIFYTRQAPRPSSLVAGLWAAKNARVMEAPDVPPEVAMRIPEIIAPGPDDIVIDKDKPSAFFGSPLLSYLIGLRIDSVMVAGTSTSGCVRATVIDAFSFNLRTMVIEDCTFDRGIVSHKVNLFDMHAKYADVVPLEVAVSHLLGKREERAVPA